MSSYLPVIISAVLIIAILLWWLLALDGVKKTGGSPKNVAPPPPAAVPAPPVAPVAKAAAAPKLMDDPKPAKKTAKAKVQAPLKAAATKAAPAAVAKPVAVKAAVAKVAAPKPAAKPVAAKAKADPAPKTAPKPIASKAKAEVAPKPKAAKPAAKAKVSIPENLELLKGVGPKVNNMLKSLGVTSFAQVASWTAADVAEIDGKLGAFAGRGLGVQAHLVHRVHDAALHRLEPVAHVGKRPMHDRRQGIGEVTLLERRLQIDRVYVVAAVTGRNKTFPHGSQLDENTVNSKESRHSGCGLRGV